MRSIILSRLANCPRDLGMRQSTLAHEVSLDLGRDPGDGEMTDALNKLKADGLVSTARDEITGDAIFIATDKARRALYR